MVHIALKSLLAITITVGVAHGQTTSKFDTSQGKVFDSFLQLWFENQVYAYPLHPFSYLLTYYMDCFFIRTFQPLPKLLVLLIS